MRHALTTSLILAFAGTAAVRADSDTVDHTLFTAVADNDTALVRNLILDGARVDAHDANDNTSLMIASVYGYTEVARLLISAGADLDARGRIGNTALIYAVQQGQTEPVRILVAEGANVDLRNEYGSNARDLAAGHGHRDIAEILNALPETDPETRAAPLLAAVSKRRTRQLR